jgi:Rrf2 family protein
MEGNRDMSKSGSSLQLNRSADYAIRALIYLARVPEGERTLLPELAEATNTPESFLSKILQELCHAKLVASTRGHSGGFSILPAGRQATVATVIGAIDGPIRINSCLDPCDDSCGMRCECPAHRIFANAQSALLQALEAKTISDLAQEERIYPVEIDRT